MNSNSASLEKPEPPKCNFPGCGQEFVNDVAKVEHVQITGHYSRTEPQTWPCTNCGKDHEVNTACFRPAPFSSPLETPSPCRIKKGAFDRWYIFHPTSDHLAWSGSRWAPTMANGLPAGEVQIANFDSESEAQKASGAKLLSGERWLAVRGFADSRNYSASVLGPLLEEYAAYRATPFPAESSPKPEPK